MGEFYIKNSRVLYKLSNGKELVDTYNKEKDSELKKNLEYMEDTIYFKENYKPYDYSFVNIDFNNVNVKEEIKKYLKTLNDDMPNKIVLGVNTKGEYKDKWFIILNGKAKVLDDINIKLFCARVDYTRSTGNVCIQYMKDENGKVIKEEFKLNKNSSNNDYDDVLKEFLK